MIRPAAISAYNFFIYTHSEVVIEWMRIMSSIKNKILLVLVATFAVLITATTLFSAKNEADLAMDMAIDKTRNIAVNYFDNINTMMLTGTIKQRDVVAQKLLEDPDITKVKILRSEAINKLYGPGNADQVVEDDIDRQGFSLREPEVFEYDNDSGRMISVVLPMYASENYKGTNCLGCHAVEADTLLGTVRVDYSLARLDKDVLKNFFALTAINVTVMVIGLILLTIYLGRVVLNPLIKIRDIMRDNADSRDLTNNIHINTDDEIGQVAKAFNTLLDHFADSLNHVSSTVEQLQNSAHTISSSAEETLKAVTEQGRETASVAQSVTELESSAENLGISATQVSDASDEADGDAKQGTKTTYAAIEGIQQLMNSIEETSDVIMTLDKQSEGVSAVLDVIRTIAEQTNLLALNAAIEAARAGEQGRGFAVVADEVRTLANRSHESTQQIEEIVEQLQGGAKRAVEAMDNAKTDAGHRRDEVQTADETLRSIAERVSKIHHMNSDMASTVSEQERITRNVQSSINSINATSSNTTQAASSTTQASEDIVRLADDLSRKINQFKF